MCPSDVNDINCSTILSCSILLKEHASQRVNIDGGLVSKCNAPPRRAVLFTKELPGSNSSPGITLR